MKLILSDSNNPYYNLAVEEWAVRNIDTSDCDYLFLYVNKDCVVVGRNQNVFQEVNIDYCKKNNIDICRRVSGGGTVFHDLQNINWTFISKFDLKKVNNYNIFSESIIAVLKQIGLNAVLNERNAIMVGNTKVSGQAQFTNRKNILSHGTLLVGSNVERLNDSTIITNYKVETKAIKSVRSDVKTINDLTEKTNSIKSLKEFIVNENEITETFDILETVIDSDIKAIETTYRTKKWIYERSSSCIIEKEFKGMILKLKIEKSFVTKVSNKKGEEIKLHPFLNCNILDFI